VAANSILIDKLLATVISLKASDLHITVGQPPVIRHQGRMRRLDTKSLEQDDTTALMKSITPDRCQQELQEKGGSDFAIEFTDGYRFRVAIFKQRGKLVLASASRHPLDLHIQDDSDQHSYRRTFIESDCPGDVGVRRIFPEYREKCPSCENLRKDCEAGRGE